MFSFSACTALHTVPAVAAVALNHAAKQLSAGTLPLHLGFISNSWPQCDDPTPWLTLLLFQPALHRRAVLQQCCAASNLLCSGNEPPVARCSVPEQLFLQPGAIETPRLKASMDADILNPALNVEGWMPQTALLTSEEIQWFHNAGDR